MPRSIGQGLPALTRAAIRWSLDAKCGHRPVRNKCAFLRVATERPARISTASIAVKSRACCRLKQRTAPTHIAPKPQEPSKSVSVEGRPMLGRSQRLVRKRRCRSPSHRQRARAPHKSLRHQRSVRSFLIQWPRLRFRRRTLKHLIGCLTVVLFGRPVKLLWQNRGECRICI